MCIKIGGSAPPAPMIDQRSAPTVSRIPDQLLESKLPDKKNIVDEDDVKTEVKYGSSAKQGSTAAGAKLGTDALRIPLNTGATAGSNTGGVNV